MIMTSRSKARQLPQDFYDTFAIPCTCIEVRGYKWAKEIKCPICPERAGTYNVIDNVGVFVNEEGEHFCFPLVGKITMILENYGYERELALKPALKYAYELADYKANLKWRDLKKASREEFAKQNRIATKTTLWY